MRASRGRACRKGQRAFPLGDFPATAGGPARYQCVGISIQNGGFCMAQTKPQGQNMVLRHGLLDTQQCGNLPAGNAGPPETTR